MFMIEGVVLNVPSAMQEPRDGFPPVTMFPRGTEEAPSPRRGFFFFGLVGIQGSVQAIRRSGESRTRDGLLQVSRGTGSPEKVKPGRWAGLPPFQAYDFPSRTRESQCVNVSRASVAILGRLEGRLEADGNKSAALPKSHMGEGGGFRAQVAKR